MRSTGAVTSYLPRRCTQLCTMAMLCAIALLCIAPDTSFAEGPSLTVTEAYVYPEDSSRMNKLEGYVWPEVTELNLLVRVETEGYRGDQKIEFYYALFDEEDELIGKDKQKFFLPAGENNMVAPGIISTEDVFGRRTFSVDYEISMKGADPIRNSIRFDLQGPDPPDVRFAALEVYRTEGGPGDTWFRVGDGFMIEALIDISDNHSRAEPVIEIFCMMEEDSFELNPENDYLPLADHRGMKVIEGTDGRWRLRANGFLPYLFSEPYEYTHDFRIVVSVDFGMDARTTEELTGRIYDPTSGNHRYSEELEERLIFLNEPYTWRVREVPHDYMWDKYRRDDW